MKNKQSPLQRIKTDEEKLEQVERILKLLRKRDQNNEYFNNIYKKLTNKIKFNK